MKNEKILNAIGNINDEMILNALEEPEKEAGKLKKSDWKKHNGWLRRAVIAACLCLVISMPVLAIGQVLRVKLMPEQHLWEVTTQGRFPMEAFSKEALERAEALGTEDGIYPMSGVEEAEEFLGVSLPENTLLEEAKKWSFDLQLENGERVIGKTITFLINNIESKLVAVWVENRYLYNGMDVWVDYKLVTELNPYEDGGGMAVETDENHEQIKETYVTASGRECTIIFSDDEKTCDGYAYLDIDGVLTAVTVRNGMAEDVRACLYQIVDAYK